MRYTILLLSWWILYSYLLCLINIEFWRDSTQPKATNPPSRIDESLRYTNEGHNYIVELVDVNTNDPDIINDTIKFLILNTMLVTKDFLKSSNVPDIVSIPIPSEDYINESNDLTQ